MKNLYLILIIALASCTTKIKEHKPRNFDRYVIGYTALKSPSIFDSVEITSTICYRLIYITKDNYCEVLDQEGDKIHFYKGFAKNDLADSLISKIEQTNKKLNETYNIGNSSDPEINIILETDTTSIYKCVNYCDKKLRRLVNNFKFENSLTVTDTIENLLKYKYYISNRMSYLRCRYDNFAPVDNAIINDVFKKHQIHLQEPISGK